jgi:hypothetical protein
MNIMTKIIVVAMILFPVKVFAYEINIHIKATSQAVSLSGLDSYLANYHNIDLNKKLSVRLRGGYYYTDTVSKWISNGGKWEDDFPRFKNHFYDPTTDLGLNGLLYNFESSLLWANSDSGNDQGWNAARNNFYQSLVATSSSDREENLANTFQGVGQVMHLVEDLAAPTHVRNDIHLPVNTQKDLFEEFTNKKYLEMTYTGYPVVDLQTFSTVDKFWKNSGKGLAEFTNKNFLSRDTNFDDNKYSLPVSIGEWVATETINVAKKGPKQVQVKYFQGYATDTYQPAKSAPISRLAAYSYLDAERKRINNKRAYALNDAVHKEYAQFLIPRAVSYAAGMLNYFFRGTIELSLPAQGIYAIAEPDSSGYREIRVKAKNSTAVNEEMPNGSLQLVVKYKLALTNPLQSEPFDVGPEQYIVVPEKNNVRTLSRTTPTELVFDLSTNPLPLWAVDVYLQVVYRGQLGNEADAVAVGLRDISEPTPIDIVNHMDLVCVNNTLLTAGSAAAIAAVDTNADGNADWDIFPHGLTNVYLAFNGAQASSTNRSASFANIPPGSYGRVFLLGDYSGSSSALMVSTAVTVQKLDGRDVWGLAFGSGVDAIDAVDNQSYYPEMYTVRALQSWWYTYYDTLAYPVNASCDLTTAQPNIAGPVTVSFP